MMGSANTTSKPKKRRWLVLLRPKVAIPLVLVVMLLLSPLLIRGWNLSQIPDLGDPYSEREPPELEESDNAWVNYQRAEGLRVQPSTEEAKAQYQAFIEDNGLLLEKMFISKWNSRGADLRLSPNRPVPNENQLLQRYFEQNLVALEEWKAGTTKTHYYEVKRPLDLYRSIRWPNRSIRWDESEDEETELLPVHEFAVLKAGQLAYQGMQAEALDWMLAVYRYSRHLTQSGGTANWQRAIVVSRVLFRNLDELLHGEGFTHDELIAFLHELEESYKLTGTLERAQLEDYFTLKQRLTEACEKGEKYREELANTIDHPGLWIAPESKSNFELFLEGEPQLSIRVMQHHFESLKRNLKKPVPIRATDAGAAWGSDADGVTLSAERWEEFLSKAGLLDLAVSQRDLFTNPFLAEDDAAIFEGLRILIAAHAFARKRSSDRLTEITMEALIADSLGETPQDPYDPSLPLILAAGQDGRLYVLTSASRKYEHLANGGSLETIPENLKYSTLSLIINGHHPPDKPAFDELMIRLPIEE